MDKKRHSESEEQHSSQMPIKEESSSQDEEEEEEEIEEDKNILKTHNAIRSSLSRHRSVDNLNEEQNIEVVEENKNKRQMYSSMLNLKVVEDGLSSGSKGNNVKAKKKSIRKSGNVHNIIHKNAN